MVGSVELLIILVVYVGGVVMVLLGLYAVVRFGVRDGMRDAERRRDDEAERRRLAETLARSPRSDP